jgi:hypothetical protein
LLRSTDAGESWSGLSLSAAPIDVTDLAIDPVTPTTLYAVVLPGFVGNVGAADSSGVYKSKDGGATWTLLAVPSSLNPVSVTIDPMTPATLYVAGTGVDKSTDGGASWAPADTGLPDSAITAFVVDAAAPATLYAGTGGRGVFTTADGGASWTALDSGMTTLSVGALAIDPAIGTSLYALAFGNDGPHLFALATCASARCTVDAGLTSAACLGQRMPPGVRRRLDRGAALIDQGSGRLRRRRVRGVKVLTRAATAAGAAQRRGRRRITADCATTLVAAVHEATATLGR